MPLYEYQVKRIFTAQEPHPPMVGMLPNKEDGKEYQFVNRKEEERVLHTSSTQEQLDALKGVWDALQSTAPNIFEPRRVEDGFAMESQRAVTFLQSLPVDSPTLTEKLLRREPVASSRIVIADNQDVFVVESSGRLKEYWTSNQGSVTNFFELGVQYLEHHADVKPGYAKTLIDFGQGDEKTHLKMTFVGNYANPETQSAVGEFINKIPSPEPQK